MRQAVSGRAELLPLKSLKTMAMAGDLGQLQPSNRPLNRFKISSCVGSTDLSSVRSYFDGCFGLLHIGLMGTTTIKECIWRFRKRGVSVKAVECRRMCLSTSTRWNDHRDPDMHSVGVYLNPDVVWSDIWGAGDRLTLLGGSQGVCLHLGI